MSVAGLEADGRRALNTTKLGLCESTRSLRAASSTAHAARTVVSPGSDLAVNGAMQSVALPCFTQVSAQLSTESVGTCYGPGARLGTSTTSLRASAPFRENGNDTIDGAGLGIAHLSLSPRRALDATVRGLNFSLSGS